MKTIDTRDLITSDFITFSTRNFCSKNSSFILYTISCPRDPFSSVCEIPLLPECFLLHEIMDVEKTIIPGGRIPRRTMKSRSTWPLMGDGWDRKAKYEKHSEALGESRVVGLKETMNSSCPSWKDSNLIIVSTLAF